MYAYKEEIKIFKMLSHPTRIAILELLRDGEQCVCHLEAALGLRQAYISQQLIALRKAGIVTDRREGWNIYYRVVSPQIYAVLDTVYQLTGTPVADITATPVACSCPHCVAEEEMLVIPQTLNV